MTDWEGSAAPYITALPPLDLVALTEDTSTRRHPLRPFLFSRRAFLAGRPHNMGQANSTGAADAQTRRRSRPLSWAPGLLASSQPNDDTVPELLHRAPDTPSRSRPSTTRISNRLSSHFGRHDAGSSAPEDAPVPSRSRSRLHRARSSLSSMTGLLSRRPPLPARNTEPTSGFFAIFPKM